MNQMSSECEGIPATSDSYCIKLSQFVLIRTSATSNNYMNI